MAIIQISDGNLQIINTRGSGCYGCGSVFVNYGCNPCDYLR